ncbi:serine carboxypeptidase-like 18 [Medicago truncatula]|uniref:serine carboxypeptidase-like 18 n=1 Tax=Medicago truncatula TaxID=3880 RepID=UPI001967EE68|nr:serine carboxypeptidase-like 18 [Medicago truncatula]
MAVYLIRSCSWLLIVLTLFIHADCGDIVKTLPGFPGELPFTLETGYIGVEHSELFYLFVESTGNPKTDPLLLYLIGGPGCSALNAFFFQVGPLAFNEADYTGGLPQLILRSYPWTKSASIIFLDAPVGTGYSYSTSPESLVPSDSMSARQTYKFLRQWLMEHPQYLLNPVLIVGDSYSGMLAPIISKHILDGNAAGPKPYITLIGMIGGSPVTSIALENNTKIIMAHRLTLISDSLYEEAKESCEGWYIDVNPSNTKCVKALQEIDELLTDINVANVLDPNCERLSPKPNDTRSRRVLKGKETNFQWQFQKQHHQKWWCKSYVYLLSYIWANDEKVQEALHVREGRVKEW